MPGHEDHRVITSWPVRKKNPAMGSVRPVISVNNVQFNPMRSIGMIDAAFITKSSGWRYRSAVYLKGISPPFTDSPWGVVAPMRGTFRRGGRQVRGEQISGVDEGCERRQSGVKLDIRCQHMQSVGEGSVLWGRGVGVKDGQDESFVNKLRCRCLVKCEQESRTVSDICLRIRNGCRGEGRRTYSAQSGFPRDLREMSIR